MNTFIAFASLLAVAAANPGLAGLGYAGLGYNSLGYSGAYAHAAPLAYGYAGLASEARLIDPVAIAAGAPLPGGDTVEVAAGKAANAHAHAVANARTIGAVGYSSYAAPLTYAAPQAYAYAAPQAYGYAHAAAPGPYSQVRLVDPVAIAAGAPLPTGDTVEVAHAKALHFQAHAAAKSGLRYKRGLGYAHGSHAVAYNAPLVHAAHPVAHHAVAAYAAPIVHANHAVAYNAPLVNAHGSHAVAYNAPLVHAAHPVAHHAVAAYAAPLAHASHAVAYNAPLVHAAHPVSHYAGAYAHQW